MPVVCLLSWGLSYSLSHYKHGWPTPYLSHDNHAFLSSPDTHAVLLFSSLVFYSEELHRSLYGDTGHRVFKSIPGTFWWCIVTLATIGYGDQVPQTSFGKVTAGILMGCAILIMSLPISVIGAQFTEHWMNFKKQANREQRTAIAFVNLNELVDTLVDNFKVVFDFMDLSTILFTCTFAYLHLQLIARACQCVPLLNWRLQW